MEQNVSAQAESALSVKKKPAKKRRRMIAGGVFALLVVAFVVLNNAFRTADAPLALDDTSVIAYTDLTHAISATGVVISEQTRNVYSSQPYEIAEVFVSAGDAVKAGDALLKLDASTLEQTIQKREMSIEASKKSGKQQVKTARDSYNAAKSALLEGLNSTILQAENQVTSAYNTWQKARKVYDDYLEGLKLGQNSQILQNKSSLSGAERTLDSAQSAHHQALINITQIDDQIMDVKAALKDSPADPTLTAKLEQLEASRKTAGNALDNARNSVYAANDAYDLAKTSLRATERNTDLTLEDYKIAADSAYDAYASALTMLSATEHNVNTQLTASKNSLASAQIGADMALALYELETLYEELDKTTIKAPIDGTVTAVYAKAGNSGSGLLFVIEDTAQLLVDTTVKEYDVHTVQIGQRAIISSDALKDAKIEGRVRNISPAAKKTQTGAVDTVSDALFPTEVQIVQADSGLFIGMSVRLSYIIEEKQHVLAVPYEAVFTDEAGQSAILVAEPLQSGKYAIKKLAVVTGMETDLFIEVYGEGVVDGLRVINIAEDFKSLLGQEIGIAQQRTLAQGAAFPMMGR